MAADKALSEHPAPVAPRAPENTQRGTVRELMGLLVKAQMGLYDGKNAISEKLECDLFSRLTEFLVSEALRAELASKVAMETSATAMDSRMFLDRSRDAHQRFRLERGGEELFANGVRLRMEIRTLHQPKVRFVTDQTQRTVAALLADLSHPDHKGRAIRRCVDPEKYDINSSHYVL